MQKGPSDYQLLHGVDAPPPETLALRAGDVALEFEAGDLRYVRAFGVEAVRRIYTSVRDVNWNTITGEVTGLQVETSAAAFRIRFDSRHRTSEIDFAWSADIQGEADGRVSYTMDGRALKAFRYCRVGFCLLHPIVGTAGRPFRATGPAGVVDGTMPWLIAPQPYEDDLPLPVFPAYSQLEVDLDGGARLSYEIEGDLFELEDQRNWTDGSLKAYCTPASLGFPHNAEAGQRFFQRLSMSVSAPATAGAGEALRSVATTSRGRPPTLTIGPAAGSMPSIGFGVSSQTTRLADREIELVRKLRPAHLRVDLHLSRPGWAAELDRASREAVAVGTGLEVAVFTGDNPLGELADLAGSLTARAVTRFLVFDERDAADKSTSAELMAMARRLLSSACPGAQFVGGTNGNFAELNRTPPPPGAYDAVCYPVNPQVHAFDDRSLIEAIDGQGDTVRTARSFFDGPVAVSAVTLKPPFNQAATEDEEPTPTGDLPARVDVRQMSRFAAAWTVGSLRALAESGAESLTFFETAGWLGLFETAAGSPLADRFPSRPGMIFPVYRVFEAVADARGATILECRSSEPLLADGLALSIAGSVRVLAANLSSKPAIVRIAGLHTGSCRISRLLRDGSVPELAEISGGGLEIEMIGYEVVQVESTAGDTVPYGPGVPAVERSNGGEGS